MAPAFEDDLERLEPGHWRIGGNPDRLCVPLASESELAAFDVDVRLRRQELRHLEWRESSLAQGLECEEDAGSIAELAFELQPASPLLDGQRLEELDAPKPAQLERALTLASSQLETLAGDSLACRPGLEREARVEDPEQTHRVGPLLGQGLQGLEGFAIFRIVIESTPEQLLRSARILTLPERESEAAYAVWCSWPVALNERPQQRRLARGLSEITRQVRAAQTQTGLGLHLGFDPLERAFRQRKRPFIQLE